MNLLPAFVGAPEENRVYHCDALTLINALAPQSVDAAIFDPPYGTTACAWDEIIPLGAMWKALKRAVKPHGAIVITSSQPFTSKLVMSNLDMFKYTWVWEKTHAANFFNAKNKPLAIHEDICVFSLGTTANGSDRRMNYYPQDIVKSDAKWKRPAKYQSEHNFVRESHKLERVIEYTGYPESILRYANGNNHSVHPTQKPVALFDYLIRTYTQEGDLVLDPTCGSGTTAIAARNTGRRFICGDLDAGYVEIARQRLAQPYTPDMFLQAAGE